MTDEVQQAKVEAITKQQARVQMEAAIQEAQQRAIKDIQENMQIEIQMRSIALSEAVKAKKEGIGASAITESAEAFLKFLKTGEAVQKEQQ